MGKIGIVSKADIKTGIINKKTKKRSGLNGCVIEFTVISNLIKNSIVQILHKDKVHYFRVEEIETIDKKSLLIRAVETGYWASKFDKKKDFDLRDILDIDVEVVTEQKTLNHIQESSCWT
jgi:hypothetical protein